MKIAGLQKLTLLDYPGKTAATVFTSGCNFRCPFCHNAELALGSGGQEIELETFFSFLDKRKGLLDGICITGGEPLLLPDLASFCTEIKRRGFAVKLDTNGSHLQRLRELIEENLVDYVAVDIKNSRARYAETVGLSTLDIAPIEDTVAYLLSGSAPFEFRTTVVREYHDTASLEALARWIEGAEKWYLQSFVDSDSVLTGKGVLHGYSADELHAFLPTLRSFVKNVDVRGIA